MDGWVGGWLDLAIVLSQSEHLLFIHARFSYSRSISRHLEHVSASLPEPAAREASSTVDIILANLSVHFKATVRACVAVSEISLAAQRGSACSQAPLLSVLGSIEPVPVAGARGCQSFSRFINIT